MPKNKEALIRYRVINRCLIDKTYVTKQELKEACERALDIFPIGMRTIEADIHAMRYDEGLAYFAPIKIDRINKTYYYDDPNYSIDNIPLNEEELDSILFASKLLEQYKNVGILETFKGSVQKLVNAINVYRHHNEETSNDFIEFEKNDEAKGTEHLESLIDVIKNKQVIKIDYKSFTSTKITKHLVHPYHLKEYRNRWYLIGYHDKYKGIRTYGLDRIENIEIDYQKDYIDTGFNAKEYYKNVIGISVLDEAPVEIKIAFSEMQAQYVLSQPLHHSQKMGGEKDNKIIFKYYLVPNYEFYAQILAWGDEVEILKPDKVKKRILNLIKKIKNNY